MKYFIEGVTGNFGTFLKSQFDLQGHIFDKKSKLVILAVPASAYEECAKKHKGKHLVNVCSVQSETTEICLKYSDKVTSIHPMFGPRTKTEYISICTKFDDEHHQEAIELFKTISKVEAYVDHYGWIKPKTHDFMMAKTHLQVVLLNEQINKIVEAAKDVPEIFKTPSFKKLEEFAKSTLDMPAGTKESILSNPYRKDLS